MRWRGCCDRKVNDEGVYWRKKEAVGNACLTSMLKRNRRGMPEVRLKVVLWWGGDGLGRSVNLGGGGRQIVGDNKIKKLLKP